MVYATSMRFRLTEIDGLVVIEPNVFADDRGFFLESFNERVFSAEMQRLDLPVPMFVQDNHSSSQKAVLRGLHFQREPFAQGKLVRVVSGAAYDVAVDLRQSSKTFGKWFAIELTASNHTMLWIPPGFAHGFQALEDGTQFLYKTTQYYHRESEGSVRWDDPVLAIPWPLTPPLLSEKDRMAPLLDEITPL